MTSCLTRMKHIATKRFMLRSRVKNDPIGINLPMMNARFKNSTFPFSPTNITTAVRIRAYAGRTQHSFLE